MNHNTDSAPQWAAADDIVDGMLKSLRTSPMPTSQIAMNLLAFDHPQRLMLLAMIASTALQRLAGEDG
jgi:hypothetical protein